jgi:hypothetical protein
VRSLDGYEGVADGDYRKEAMILAGHSEALIYIAADETPGKPHPGISKAFSPPPSPLPYRMHIRPGWPGGAPREDSAAASFTGR